MGKYPGVKAWYNTEKAKTGGDVRTDTVVVERIEPIPFMNVYSVQLYDCNVSQTLNDDGSEANPACDPTSYEYEVETLQWRIEIKDDTDLATIEAKVTEALLTTSDEASINAAADSRRRLATEATSTGATEAAQATSEEL